MEKKGLSYILRPFIGRVDLPVSVEYYARPFGYGFRLVTFLILSARISVDLVMLPDLPSTIDGETIVLALDPPLLGLLPYFICAIIIAPGVTLSTA